MHFYRFTKPNHPDDGEIIASADALTIGDVAEGDARFYVPCDAPRPDLETYRAQALAKVDADAGAACAKYVTVAAMQAHRYQRKYDQARAFLANEPGPFGMLEAQAAETGDTVAMIAAEVIATADLWLPLEDAIEGKRMGAKKAIRAAASYAAIDAAIPSAEDWP